MSCKLGSKALKVQSIYNFLTFFVVTLAAVLSDRFGRKKSLMIAAIGYIIFSIPCFYFLKSYDSSLWLLQLVIFYSIEEASMPATMVEMFPVNARYTGISIAYNAAMALVGGLAIKSNHSGMTKFMR